MQQRRDDLGKCKRLVVKVGTRVLTKPSGQPERERLASLTSQIATLRKAEKEVILVTSGAIGAGVEELGLKERPKKLSQLQMAAAVGQSKLMSIYSSLFSEFHLTVGQVLLTRDGLIDKKRAQNARNTLQALLAQGVVPIVNENDTVSAEEIRFGDNDILAVMTASLVDADALILLSSTNGLVRNFGSDNAERIPYLSSVSSADLDLAVPVKDGLSLGGMKSKLEAAKQAAEKGIPTVIADGRAPDTLLRVIAGEDCGTLVASN